MEISAELILEIQKLKRGAEEARRHIRTVGVEGELASRRMNFGFARGGHQMPAAVRSSAANFGVFRASIISSGTALSTASLVFREGMNWLLRLSGAAGLASAALGGIAGAAAFRNLAQYEDAALAVGVFARNMETGRRIMDEIQGFADVTPFETAALQNLAADLMAAGVPARELMADLKGLAAISKDTETLAGIGEAFGKGFTQRKFDQEQLNKFLERQINLYPALAKAMGIAGTEGVKQAIREGKVGVEEMRAAIKTMSAPGGQFFGYMEKRSRTGSGLWSTMTSNVSSTGKALFAPLYATGKTAMENIIALAKGLGPAAAAFGKVMGDAADRFLVFFDAAPVVGWGNLISAVLLKAAKEFVNAIWSGIAPIGEIVKESFALAFDTKQPQRAIVAAGLGAAGQAYAGSGAAVGAGAAVPQFAFNSLSKFLGMFGSFAGRDAELLAKQWGAVGAAVKGSGAALTAASRAIAPNIPAESDSIAARVLDKLAKADPNRHRILGTEGEEATITGLVATVNAQLAKLTTAREREQRKQDAIDRNAPTGAGTQPESADDAATRKSTTTPGRFAQFSNALAGRSINELVVQSNREIVRELGRVRGILNKIYYDRDGDLTVNVKAQGTF